MNNPLDMLKMIKNPKDFVMNYVKQNTNPVFKNIIDMANKGDTKGVEDFARNLFKEQGKDFDQEYSDFMKNFR